MLTKTKTINEEKNDLNTNHSFSIPENIKKDISEKWFYMYNWIWEKDVKQSIERDFLKIIKSVWPVVSIILLLPATFLMIAGAIPVWIIYFFSALALINFVLLLYLGVLSIIRSNILRKNAYVLMTDSSISVNWKIKKLNEFDINELDIKKISDTFEEDIFNISRIETTKKWFFDQVLWQIWDWYSKIFKFTSWRSKNSWQIMIVWLGLYTVYAFSLWLIYFVWIFFVWIFWNILSVINKKIMLISWHEITSINSNFENIDSSSKNLLKEKNNLSNLLGEAMQNDWKDSLLTKINSWIENINKNASYAVDTSIKLKKKIKESIYKEMFNFWIYNSWIKKEILVPLFQIIALLEKNLNILKEQNISITEQIKVTPDPSLSWPLVASKTRIEMRIVEIEKHISSINGYIEKLR
jgi:hypothetical protein